MGLRAVDLFCGAGGLSLGLQRAGIEIVAAYDEWEEAAAVYSRNVGSHVQVADLEYVLWYALYIKDLNPDLIAGGPPCQDFSAAGLRKEGDRSMLMAAFAMIVVIVRPEWVLIENVRDVRQSASWADAHDILKKAGYGLTQVLVDASRYGVGQARQRFIIVGRLGEADDFLEQAILDARSERPTTIRDTLGDMENDYVFVRPYKGGRGVRFVDEPAPTIIRTSREPPTVGYLACPSPQDPAPADQVPLLTQQQTSLLQGFPPDWDWSPARRVRDIDQMIANAVPAPLAEAIGRIILARHRGEGIPTIESGFSEWLQCRGIKGQVLRNRRHALGRARKMLGGRIFANIGEELLALEKADGFAELKASTRSDMKAALRAYAEFRTITVGQKKGRKKAKPSRRRQEVAQAKGSNSEVRNASLEHANNPPADHR